MHVVLVEPPQLAGLRLQRLATAVGVANGFGAPELRRKPSRFVEDKSEWCEMRWFFVLLLGSLAGCASTPPSATTTASFIPGSDVIQVIVHNEQPVRGIQLVAPDGTVTLATSINTDRVVEPPGSSVGVGIGGFGFGRGGGFGSSVGVGFPLGGGSRPVDTVASASIPVAEAYRADWQHYHIEVLVGEPSKIISVAAPQPI